MSWNVTSHTDEAYGWTAEVLFRLRKLVGCLAGITQAGEFGAVRHRLSDQVVGFGRRAGRQRLIDELIVDGLIGAERARQLGESLLDGLLGTHKEKSWPPTR